MVRIGDVVASGENWGHGFEKVNANKIFLAVSYLVKWARAATILIGRSEIVPEEGFPCHPEVRITHLPPSSEL